MALFHPSQSALIRVRFTTEFFFEHGFIKRMLRSVGGTVFQTALPSLLVIQRLRPGLLSLRSVLASSQIYLLYN